jgi:transposase
MASLQRHVVSGRTYWRIVESRRVNGKPRPVPILYLGTADQILARLLEAPSGNLRIQSFQHGDVAALKAAADRLRVAGIIDRHVPDQRRSSPSVGTTLLLGAINRAVHPRSKRGWASWAAGTSLSRLFPGLEPDTLTSQFFWDQMDGVSLEALREIESELAQTVIQELGISLDLLFYDTTNFFTYIASDNPRPKLPQRGRNKQKRADLRQFGLALLVSRDGQIPLCSQIYEGNTVDCKLFPASLSLIRQRLAEFSVDAEALTVVYDKGNLSKANQKAVDDSGLGFVASLVPAHHADLMAIPVADYMPLPKGTKLEALPVLRMTKEVWGAERTLVLFSSEQLREGQTRGLQQHLDKRLRELAEWKEQLAAPHSGPRTPESAGKCIQDLLKGQHLAEVLRIEYHAERKGSDRLEFRVDQEALLRLHREVFGKRILITNRHHWSTEEIILAYRGQSHVESVFRQCKDDEHLAVRPQYHWTDQKIQVHAFICLLALLLARVVEREARKLGYRESLSSLLDLLGTVRLAMVLTPPGPTGGRPRTTWQLEELSPDARTLFEACVPPTPPFVYTAHSD